MRDPRSFVDAATPAVADVLTEMTRIVLTGGGVVHPGLTMIERVGAMTVRCTDSADAAPDQPLFDVPREMLIPVDGAQWADSRSKLVLTEPPPDLTPRQRDLLDLHVALYNACGKLPCIVASHPRLGLREAPDVVAAIRALRPGFDRAAVVTRHQPLKVPSPHNPDSNEPPAIQVFLGTRVFGLKPVEAADPETTRAPTPANQRVLMTLIDLLNHHPRGAPYRVDARAMTPAVARPTATGECFAQYGHRRDSLDLALNYGYVDTETQFVHCPPLTFDVPSFGTLRIVGRGSRGKPPSPLDPPRVTSEADGLTLSHIVFRAPEGGVRWDLPVFMAVQARALQVGADPAAASAQADTAVATIVDRATELLLALRTVAESGAATNPAAGVLAAVAEHQLGLLRDC